GLPSADAGLGRLRRFPWPLCRPSAGMIRAPDSGCADELKDFQAQRESPFWNALTARPFCAARSAQADPISLNRCSARILSKTEVPAKRPTALVLPASYVIFQYNFRQWTPRC